jgi:hypothetical protein
MLQGQLQQIALPKCDEFYGDRGVEQIRSSILMQMRKFLIICKDLREQNLHKPIPIAEPSARKTLLSSREPELRKTTASPLRLNDVCSLDSEADDSITTS